MQRQQCKSFVLFLSFKVLVWQIFKLISLLTVCGKQRGEKRSQAASLYHRISATMVIVPACDHFFRPKSQLVRYPNSETMRNNDKQ